MDQARLIAALDKYDFNELRSVQYIGGPGNMLVQFDTDGDCRIALLTAEYRLVWEHSLAETVAADYEAEFTIYDPPIGRAKVRLANGPTSLLPGLGQGLRDGPVELFHAGAWEKPEQPVERQSVPAAVRLGQEAIDVMEAALRGEEGLSISMLALEALCLPHRYSLKPNQYRDRVYIWRNDQYVCHLPMMAGEQIDADIAREFLDGEHIVKLPKKSV